MNYLVKINAVKTTNELEDAWSNEDYKALLARFEYPDAAQLKPAELKEYLFLAISDFEPHEAAAILLDYKCSDQLVDGQIDNLSHEMLRTKTFENYSEIDLHHDLFNINQLLYSAYNGKFPLGTVNLVEMEIKGDDNVEELTKETALKALSYGLSENNLINRLLSDQIEGHKAFPEAEGIVWELQHKGDDVYTLTISEKWLTKTEITNPEYECTVVPFEEHQEAN
ncbi:hypothetical protein [Draconibacterium sediminis]|uniref:Uncharacterized protein n=1 Tax=Draconibacterium sediminis TaxID=1544798 RepID=A0A0D8JB96_9BACT|nr:hypothetical protein [Draconibacterium sediminis]KJF44240.1 hypothetical protein LH29_01580 [Draconibacterium sediminis]